MFCEEYWVTGVSIWIWNELQKLALTWRKTNKSTGTWFGIPAGFVSPLIWFDMPRRIRNYMCKITIHVGTRLDIGNQLFSAHNQPTILRPRLTSTWHDIEPVKAANYCRSESHKVSIKARWSRGCASVSGGRMRKCERNLLLDNQTTCLLVHLGGSRLRYRYILGTSWITSWATVRVDLPCHDCRVLGFVRFEGRVPRFEGCLRG